MFRRDQSIVLYNGDNARGHGCLIARGEGGREGGINSNGIVTPRFSRLASKDVL